MMIRLVAAILLLAWPSLALAQTVTVRSGEHESFTRLVFDLPRRVEWELRQTADEAVLQLGVDAMRFDASRVFERIPQGRITNVTPRDKTGAVTIGLGCDCKVTAFWHGQSMLVVDVAGPQRAEDATPRPVRTARPVIRELPIALPERRSATAARLTTERLGQPVASPRAGTAPVPTLRSEAVLASRDSLVEQFGRAASQGLLSPNAPLSERVTLRPADAQPEEEAKTEPVLPELPPDPARNINLRAQSSIDRDFLATLADRTGALEASACIDAARFDVAAWGNDVPFTDQVGPMRAALFREFDQPDERAVVKLARLYIHVGFGAEAQQVLAMLPEPTADHRMLQEMARILEVGHAPAPSILSRQAECVTPGALWAVLAQESLSGGLKVDTDVVLRAFSSLPQHLRAHTGPILSQRFLQAGLRDESDRVLRILERHERTVTPESDFAKAELEMAEGKTAPADARLEQVVETNSTASAKALVRRIDGKLSRGEIVSYDLAQLAGAYAHEHAGTDQAAALHRVHVLALGSSGAFDEAFAELNRAAPNRMAEDSPLRAELATIIAEQADGMEFLRHVLAGRLGPPGNMAPETALAIAERLYEAGFPDPAEDFLEIRAQGSVARDARLLRARIALADGRPRQAEVDLLGLTGKDVNLLRAQARSMVGEHRQAHDLYRSAGLEDEAAREAWLARDWDVVAEGPMPELAGLNVTEDRSATEPGPGAQGVLARNRALLDGAGETRDSLEAMLAATPVPDGAEE